MENLSDSLLVLSFFAGQASISVLWYYFLYKKLGDVIEFEQNSKAKIQHHNYLLTNQVLAIKQTPVFIPDEVAMSGQSEEWDETGRRSDEHEAVLEKLGQLGGNNDQH